MICCLPGYGIGHAPACGFFTQELRAGHVRKGFEIITLDGQLDQT